MKTPYTRNAENFHRSAMAPVGTVAAVSMKTAAKRNIARCAGSCPTLTSAKLGRADTPRLCPLMVTPSSCRPVEAPPSDGQSPTPPNMIPYPRSQKPMTPTG